MKAVVHSKLAELKFKGTAVHAALESRVFRERGSVFNVIRKYLGNRRKKDFFRRQSVRDTETR